MKSSTKIRNTRGDRLFNFINITLCVIISAVIVYPLYFVVIASFSDPDYINQGLVWLWPKGANLIAYQEVFAKSRVWTGYYNTIIYTVGFTSLSLFLVLPAAYAMSRKDFTLRGVIMIYFLITMFFNGGLVPTYIQVRNLGLIDKYWAMVLPGSVNVFYLIIARTFFTNNVPSELLDAAQIDGCSNTRFFVQIVLPLTKAIIAVIALYAAVQSWNSYMNALLYIQSQEKRPLQLVLRAILINNERDSGSSTEALKKAEVLKYALVIVSTVPIMAMYPFIQKYFTQGALLGSIKG